MKTYLAYNMMTIVNTAIWLVYLKVAKRVDPKSSHHRRQKQIKIEGAGAAG